MLPPRLAPTPPQAHRESAAACRWPPGRRATPPPPHSLVPSLFLIPLCLRLPLRTRSPQSETESAAAKRASERGSEGGRVGEAVREGQRRAGTGQDTEMLDLEGQRQARTEAAGHGPGDSYAHTNRGLMSRRDFQRNSFCARRDGFGQAGSLSFRRVTVTCPDRVRKSGGRGQRDHASGPSIKTRCFRIIGYNVYKSGIREARGRNI
jgi:hypothetical protein